MWTLVCFCVRLSWFARVCACVRVCVCAHVSLRVFLRVCVLACERVCVCMHPCMSKQMSPRALCLFSSQTTLALGVAMVTGRAAVTESHGRTSLIVCVCFYVCAGSNPAPTWNTHTPIPTPLPPNDCRVFQINQWMASTLYSIWVTHCVTGGKWNMTVAFSSPHYDNCSRGKWLILPCAVEIK
jgi:hypothetical protein